MLDVNYCTSKWQNNLSEKKKNFRTGSARCAHLREASEVLWSVERTSRNVPVFFHGNALTSLIQWIVYHILFSFVEMNLNTRYFGSCMQGYICMYIYCTVLYDIENEPPLLETIKYFSPALPKRVYMCICARAFGEWSVAIWRGKMETTGIRAQHLARIRILRLDLKSTRE